MTSKFISLRIVAGSLLSLFAFGGAMAQPLLCYNESSADTVVVSSTAALVNAVNAAPPGRNILVAPGTYSAATLTFSGNGAAGNPIVIRPQNGVGTVTFTSPTWTINGTWQVFSGFYFTGAGITLQGQYNRITRCRFRTINRHAVKVGAAKDARIDRNDYSDFTSDTNTKGCIWMDKDAILAQTLKRIRVDYNYIHDINTTVGANGQAPITCGNGLSVNEYPGILIDRNLFQNVSIQGEGELISMKCSGIKITNCTMLNTGSMYLSFRVSNDSELRSSWFENMHSDGVQVYGDRHLVIGNRFIGTNLRISAGIHTMDTVIANLPNATGGYAASRYARVIGNTVASGYAVRVGGYWSSGGDTVPCQNALLEATSGTVTLLNQTGTVQSGSTTYPYVAAVKLTSSDVGMGVPESGCPQSTGTVLFSDTFTYPNGALPSIYWSEGNTATIQNNQLYVNANGGAHNASTIWLNQVFSGDLRIEFDAHVIAGGTNAVNNINNFILYSDPSGVPLYDTRASRSDGAYSKYHSLNGYITTYVNEQGSANPPLARFRLRDAPNFDNLLQEADAYSARGQVTRRIAIEKVGNRITYWVDGLLALDRIDNAFNPAHNSGLIGFRTAGTELWWDNLVVTSLSGGSAPATLAGHWQLDASSGTSAADSSGNSNTGTLSGGPAWVPARIGNGLSFDGVDDVVDSGSGATLDNLPAISVSAWINAASIGEGGFGRIVVKGTGVSGGWQFMLASTNQVLFQVQHATTTLKRSTANNAIGLNAWHHVAATWSGSTSAANVKIYVDGLEASSYATSVDGAGTRSDDAAASLYLGNESGGSRAFHGILDDVRVYNGVLSAADVLAIYQSAPTTPAAPSSLSATVVAYNQINLSWTDNSFNELGFEVERKKGAGGTYAQIASLAANTVSYNDAALGSGTNYHYRVRAINASGGSPYSNEASGTTTEVTSGRQAHWKLDETSGTIAADASGNNHTGTLTNFSGSYWVAGAIGNGLSFDGANDVVTCGSGATLDNLAAITVSAWINATSMGEGGFGRIAVKGTGVAGGWQFMVAGMNRILFQADYGTTDVKRDTADNAVTTGTWQHVTATWTGSATATNIKLYINGAETAAYGTTTNGVGSRVDDAAAIMHIGNESGGTRTFNGKIDDLRVYNRVLSLAEIQALHRSGL